jgi:hypothetical protein
MRTGFGADASACGGLATGNAASGVMGVGGISAAWDVGGDAASFVPKINWRC